MYEAFADAVNSEMCEIEESDFNANTMIKELDANDPKIFKK